jgi:hypothetical protein
MLENVRQSDNEGDFPVNDLYVGKFIALAGELETGVALMELAYAHACLGEIERAESLIAEFEHFFRDASYQPRLMILLGFLAFFKGEAEPAVRYFQKSLRCAVQRQWPMEAMLALEGYAWALSLAARPVEAARMLGAAAEFRTRIGSPVFSRDRPVYDQVITASKASLGEEGYMPAWAKGQAQGFDKGVDNAIAKPNISRQIIITPEHLGSVSDISRTQSAEK